MKKNTIIAALATASAILVSASCTKQEQPAPTNEAKVFTAVIEQEATKTVLTSANKVEWVSGDLIYVNDALYSATPNSSDATKATFTLSTGMEPTSPYYAIYPTDLFTSVGSYEFPGTQYYSASEFIAPMYAESTTQNFSFKNICGVLCFSLKGTDKVKSIKITANEPVCGAFTMTDATTVNFTGTDKSVVLSCTSAVQLNPSTATDFYIYLPPQTYTAGMKVVITNADGDIFEITTTKSAVVARNGFYVFNWTPVFVPVTVLSGMFSVSATKQVQFSSGNLTYDVSSNRWGFYKHQYDCASAYDSNLISLFTWGYGTWSTTPDTESYLTGSYLPLESFEASKDWGVTIDSEGTWHTLTYAEWMYLFNLPTFENTTRAGLYAYGVTVVDKANCVVLYPDGYTGTKVANGDTTSYDTVAEWTAAQNAGVVCLPAAGARLGSDVDDVGVSGYYWSSSVLDTDLSAALSFDSSTVTITDGSCSLGLPVRLVTDAD